MVFTAVGVLIFLASLAVGTNDAMIRNSVGLYSGHIVGDGLSTDAASGQLLVDGVQQVLIRGYMPLRLRHQDHLSATTLVAVNPDREKEVTALWKKTVAGRYLRSGEPEVYLSESVSQSLQVAVGQKVQVETQAGTKVAVLTVCGIYRTGVSSLDYGMGFVPRKALTIPNGTLSTAVFLKNGVDPQAVLALYRRLPDAPRFTPWTQFMPDLKQLIDLNFVSMMIVMLLVFGVVSLGISCAFVIFILKYMREHGIMKAMGMLPGESALLIFAEVTLMTLVASAVGVCAGALAVAGFSQTGIDLTSWTSHNQYFTLSGVIYPRLTMYSLWTPPLLANVFGILASVWPTIFVIRGKAADILRSI